MLADRSLNIQIKNNFGKFKSTIKEFNLSYCCKVNLTFFKEYMEEGKSLIESTEIIIKK